MEEQKKLYVPNNLKLRPETFAGFGRAEMRITVIAVLIALGIVLVMGKVFGVSLLVCVITFLVAGGGTVLAIIKDPVANISMVDQIRFMIRFGKAQKSYPYICHGFWRGEKGWK